MQQRILSTKEVTAQFGDGTVLLTVKQACDRFGVSPSWIYAHKELPSLRIGKGLRFIEADLLAFFKRQALRLK
jgi:excisionase family DNA binding protein